MEIIIKLDTGQIVRRCESCRELAFSAISRYDFDQFSIAFESERPLDISAFNVLLDEINQACGTTISAQVNAAQGLFDGTFYELTTYFENTGVWYIAFWWVTAVQRCFVWDKVGVAKTVEESFGVDGAWSSSGTMKATRDAWKHFKSDPGFWLKDTTRDDFHDGVATFWYGSFGGQYDSYFDDPAYREGW